MGLVGIFKHIAERKKEQITSARKGDLARIDNNLPLGIKINCMIGLDETKFILHGDLLKVQSPGGGKHTVTAAEKFRIGGLEMFRIYLESNDTGNSSLLQIGVDDGSISGINLFRVYDEIYPANENEWDEWMNNENGLIGYRDFQITNDDGSVFEYQRMWGGDDEYAEPFHFESTVACDPYGTSGMKMRSTGMIYYRDIADAFREFLFMAQETVLKDDGDIDEAKIVLLIGIGLEQAELTVMA
jgi:hypothetical protein